MLIMVFQVGQDRYGLKSSEISEITPMVNLRKIQHTPPQILGVANYRGNIVPVIDLSLLLANKPSQHVLSTRIIMVKFSRDGKYFPLGLIAEHATDAIVCKKEDFQSSPVNLETAPYLGEVILDKEGMIQVLEVNKILPKELQEVLYANEARAET